MYRNVRTILLFALFGSIWSDSNLPGSLNQMDDECFKESGLDRADYEQYLANPSIDNFFDGNKSCYYLCVGKKAGEVNTDGTLKIDGIIKPGMENIVSPLLRDFLNKCVKETGETPCVTLKKNIQCMLNSIRTLLPSDPPQTE